MAYIKENPSSRKRKAAGKSSTYKTEYTLTDYASESAAETAVNTAITDFGPVSVDGVLLSTIEVSMDPVGRVGSYVASVDYRHESKSRDEPDEPYSGETLTFNFSSGGQTFFTNAIAQSKHGTDAKEVGLSINVLTDGTVEGLDVPIPGDGFQVQKIIDIGSTSSAVNDWLKARVLQRYTVNDATFRGHDAGDCMFLGFSGRAVSGNKFDITFDFAVQLGEDYTTDTFDTGLETFTIGKVVKGFEVIWIQYDPFEDTTNKVIVPKAKGVYVAQVFEESDFSTIGVSI